MILRLFIATVRASRESRRAAVPFVAARQHKKWLWCMKHVPLGRWHYAKRGREGLGLDRNTLLLQTNSVKPPVLDPTVVNPQAGMVQCSGA